MVDSGTTVFGLEVAVSGPSFMCEAVGLNARWLGQLRRIVSPNPSKLRGRGTNLHFDHVGFGIECHG
jgi:hypothetical protein